MNISLRHPWNLLARLSTKPVFNRLLPDLWQIELGYRGFIGKPPSLHNPQRFTEKLQVIKLSPWLKEQNRLTDKWLVREYVTRKVGGDFLVPLYGVYETPDTIKPELLPEAFVLKSTHDSGSVILCRQKSDCDWPEIIKQMERSAAKDYSRPNRENNYRNIKPRIVCEQLLLEEDGKPPKDFKIFCFHGTPKFIQVDIDRFNSHKRVIYGTDWVKQPFNISFQLTDTEAEKPECLNDMLKISARLSEHIPFLRVDLYVHQGKIYFGELTFIHGAGYEQFYPDEADKMVGSWLDLAWLTDKSA